MFGLIKTRSREIQVLSSYVVVVLLFLEVFDLFARLECSLRNDSLVERTRSAPAAIGALV